jgi:hypothetical protein
LFFTGEPLFVPSAFKEPAAGSQLGKQGPITQSPLHRRCLAGSAKVAFFCS